MELQNPVVASIADQHAQLLGHPNRRTLFKDARVPIYDMKADRVITHGMVARIVELRSDDFFQPAFGISIQVDSIQTKRAVSERAE